MMKNMDSIIKELDMTMGWDRHFREIKLTAAAYDLSYSAAKLPDNKPRNRYRDVSPFDHNRVKLLTRENDYINASLIDMPKADRKYILTQGPLNQTSGHFWQMVWEQKSAAVVMLNKIIEKGTLKCSQYYPLGNEPLQFAESGFTITNKNQQVYSNFTVRYLDLRNDTTDETREITQFHYTAWPDFGVPESPAAFLNFLNCVRDRNVLESTVGPAVIHCSAGIGRSGTFVLVDLCLIFIEKDIDFEVKDTLLNLRRQRMGLIQTVDQLRFSYCAIAEGARGMTDETPSDNISDEDTQDSASDSECSSDDNQGDNPHENGKSNHNAHEENTRKRRAEDKSQHEDRHDEKKGRQDPVAPVDNIHDRLDDLPPLPPPPPPPRKESLPESNNNTDANLRKRKASERQEALRNHVSEIKHKMKDSEKVNRRRAWLPYVVGGAVLITVCSAAAYYFYKGVGK